MPRTYDYLKININDDSRIIMVIHINLKCGCISLDRLCDPHYQHKSHHRTLVLYKRLNTSNPYNSHNSTPISTHEMTISMIHNR